MFAVHSNNLPKAKKKLEPSFELNVVVNIEGSQNRTNKTRFTSVKLSKNDSAFNFETKKEDFDFIFPKERHILAQKSKVRVYKKCL